MCDYSLLGISQRLAIEGEQLQVYRFPTSSLGLASLVESQKLEKKSAPQPGGSFWSWLKNWRSMSVELAPPAVCIPPGAQLRLRDIPERL